MNNLPFRILRKTYVAITKQLLSLQNLYKYRAHPSPNEVVWVDVDLIDKFIDDANVVHWRIPGAVVPGDWDLQIAGDRESILYNSDTFKGAKFKAINEHFIHGVPWPKTELFSKWYRQILEKEGQVKGCKSMQELEEYYEYYDEVFESFKENGFLPPGNKVDAIYMYIDRNGDFIFSSNGNHRLSMAIILGLKKIPARIMWRHEEWQKAKEALANKQANQKLLNSPDMKRHPDLVNSILKTQ